MSWLSRRELTTLQINVGKVCNQNVGIAMLMLGLIDAKR